MVFLCQLAAKKKKAIPPGQEGKEIPDPIPEWPQQLS